MRTSKATGIATIAVMALGLPLVAAFAWGMLKADDRIILTEGSDRFPNTTAEDWVTYADHVVVVSPGRQREIPPSAGEVGRGEGLILRQLTLRVHEVLWSSPDAKKAVPSSFPWTALGWRFKGEPSNRVEMAPADAPRLEPRHTYVMAIKWEEERCTADDHVPARWTGLGADSTVPFDDQQIANGEFEGQVRSAEEARREIRADDPRPSLEDRLAGRGAAALQQALRATAPGIEQPFGPPESSVGCG